MSTAMAQASGTEHDIEPNSRMATSTKSSKRFQKSRAQSANPGGNRETTSPHDQSFSSTSNRTSSLERVTVAIYEVASGQSAARTRPLARTQLGHGRRSN